MTKALILVGLLLSSSIGQANAPLRPVYDYFKPLSASADFWRGVYRPDLARQVLNKLLLAEPDNITLLHARGMLEVRFEPSLCFNWARNLQRSHPEHWRSQHLATACQLATQDRLELAKARHLANKDRHAEAAAIYARLFSKHGAHGDHLLESLLVRIAAGEEWKKLGREFERLLQQLPNHPDAELAYIDYLASNPRGRLQALRRIPRALRQAEIPRDSLLSRWRSLIRELTSGSSFRRQQVKAYLAWDPGNAEFSAELQRNRISSIREQADVLVARGQTDTAFKLLQQALGSYPKAHWIRHDLARLLIAKGESAAARRLIQDAQARWPKDPELAYVAALIYAATDDYGAALQALADLPKLDADLRELQTKMLRGLSMQIARAALNNGQITAAEAALQPWLGNSEDLEFWQLMLQIGQAQGDAIAILRARIQMRIAAPERRWLHLDLLDQLQTQGQWLFALRLGQQLWQENDQEDFRSALIRRAKQWPAVQQGWIQDWLNSEPRNATAWFWAIELALDGQRYDDAEHYLQLAPAQSFSPEDAERWKKLARALAERQDHFLALGTDSELKPGDAGISELSRHSLVFEYQRPHDWDEHWRVLGELIDIRAGRPANDLNALSDYAQYATLAPGTTIAAPTENAEQALALGVEWQDKNWEADLGLIALGFEQEALVGGLRWADRWGSHQWQAELARRPTNASFLSLAGDRDPLSGLFWGQVLNHNFNANIARYEARYSYRGSLSWQWLDGRRTKDNQALRGKISGDIRVYDKPAHSLDVAATLRHWRYDNNQRFYSFGHGGYYSPQSYTSLGFTLDWRGRHQRWSWQFRPGLSYSQSRENDTPHFPNDPALQTLADGINGGPLFYSGGSGSGTGLSLLAALEYRYSEKHSIGLRYAQDRSDFYEPDFLQLYWRRHWTTQHLLPFKPPKPPKRYLEY